MVSRTEIFRSHHFRGQPFLPRGNAKWGPRGGFAWPPPGRGLQGEARGRKALPGASGHPWDARVLEGSQLISDSMHLVSVNI